MFSASPLLRLLLPMAAGIGLGEYAYEHLNCVVLLFL